MIDKLNRPDAVSPYAITKPKESDEDQHHQHDSKEEAEHNYQKQISEGLTGLSSNRVRIKSVSVNKSEISKCLFRAVYLHGGVVLLKLDVVWANGRRTDNAIIIQRRLEHFIKLKKLTKGQQVPDVFWSQGNKVELGVPENYDTVPNKKNVDKKVVKKNILPNDFFNSSNFGILLLVIFFLIITIIAMISKS